jgi:hypothetical protein
MVVEMVKVNHWVYGFCPLSGILNMDKFTLTDGDGESMGLWILSIVRNFKYG